MVTPVLFVTRITNYAEIQRTLVDGCKFRIFPVVDSADSQLLIGTISKNCLEELLDAQVCSRIEYFTQPQSRIEYFETVRIT
ncbi:hypothetical protein Y032_0187g1106 [Ancylostoma ceylanicum]|uniref:CBS domain-containing protein n=1 Tax=Ancylostoma ceylanicum TaxID=53326 RepID=A0A016SRJ9_9BILA|nr:hypothetical protein Y032_0187g1106 [Ancylostoma ceylanicum]